MASSSRLVGRLRTRPSEQVLFNANDGQLEEYADEVGPEVRDKESRQEVIDLKRYQIRCGKLE